MSTPKRKSGLVNPFAVMERVRSFDAQQALQPEPGAQKLDPSAIRPSRWANRHETSFAGQDFAALKDEIESAGGNVQPIKVRPAGDGFELVFGHRRHRACLELGLQVLAVVEPLTDAELFAQMDRENRSRKDLSAWEQGMMYRRALDAGLFPSLRMLAKDIGRDATAVSEALRIADLPAEVVAAFKSPNDIQFRWAKPLADACAQDLDGVLARAKNAAGGAMEAAEVLAVLTAKTGTVGPSYTPSSAPPSKLDLGRGRHVKVSKKGDRTVLEFDAALIGPDGWAALERCLRKIAKN